MRFNTGLLHGGVNRGEAHGATLTPIYQSSAFEHETAETVWFGDGNAFAAQYHTGDKVSVVYQPKFREYRGVRSIQMQIKEIKPDT